MSTGTTMLRRTTSPVASSASGRRSSPTSSARSHPGASSQSLRSSLPPSVAAGLPAQMKFSIPGATAPPARHAPSPPKRPTTPTSSRSSVAQTAELEDVISDVMHQRLQSLNELRKRIDELGDLHRREATSFASAMQTVLSQSAAAREAHMQLEGGMESELQRERFERRRAMQLIEQFKHEGTQVMNGLREALRDLQKKYRVEVDKNQELTAQVRRLERAVAEQGGEGGRPSGNGSAGGAPDMRAKVATLAQLLEESDGIIGELERRNTALEQRVAHLTEQRDRLLDVDSQHVSGEHFSREIKDILSSVMDGATASSSGPDYYTEDRSPATPAGSGSAASAIDRQVVMKLVNMMSQQLRAEQRQRLRTEEQAARMAAGQDELLRKMEQRVKELEGRIVAGGPPYAAVAASAFAEGGGTSGIAGAGRGSPLRRPAGGLVGAAGGGIGTPRSVTDVMVVKPLPVPAARVPALQSMAPVLSPVGGGASSGATSTTTQSSAAVVPPAVAPARDDSTTSGGSATRPAVVAAPTGQSLHKLPRLTSANPDPRPSGHVVESPMHPVASIPAAVPGEPAQPAMIGLEEGSIPSLEAQLNAVTADFQLSMAQWTESINADAAKAGISSTRQASDATTGGSGTVGTKRRLFPQAQTVPQANITSATTSGGDALGHDADFLPDSP